MIAAHTKQCYDHVAAILLNGQGESSFGGAKVNKKFYAIYSKNSVFYTYVILSHLSDMLSHIPQWHKGCNNVGESHKELKRKQTNT